MERRVTVSPARASVSRLDPSNAGVPAEDHADLDALRAGDEGTFMALVERHHASMTRLARLYVPSPAIAEEVVQETWLAVLEGLDRFEGRSSLKTWIFRIVLNRARTRGERERRSVPFSALEAAAEREEAAVDPSRFLGTDHPRWPGHWAVEPRAWETVPEARVASRETLERIGSAIEELPLGQRAVITLRDVHGWSAVEVCNALQISETNQRVLLHRARSRVRRALERYFDDDDDGSEAVEEPAR